MTDLVLPAKKSVRRGTQNARWKIVAREMALSRGLPQGPGSVRDEKRFLCCNLQVRAVILYCVYICVSTYILSVASILRTVEGGECTKRGYKLVLSTSVVVLYHGWTLEC